jgi:hypothetical protein
MIDPSALANAEARFWSKVRLHPTECWLWQASTTSGPMSYGTFWIDGRSELAHRVGWSMVNGSIPVGIDILHSCDTPLCIRPSHWFPGTRAQNNLDRDRKGRQARGESNGRAKLKLADVIAIRASNEKHAVIAAHYGLSYDYINAIKSGKRWSHAK